MQEDTHKAGFVALVGRPNAGKSTLLNSLLGEKLVITSPKAQTTRHRIIGLYNDDNTQIVFSDTPGVITPDYQLHERMMKAVNETLQDSDLILWIADVNDDLTLLKDTITDLKSRTHVPILLLINKVESDKQEKRYRYWKELYSPVLGESNIMAISALNSTNLEQVLDYIRTKLPIHPPFYDKELLAISQTRFFVSELIRETIFEQYDQEIPYQTTVNIIEYKEKPDITVIRAEVVAYRETQKGILIGKGGTGIKKLSTTSRNKIEQFLESKVFLDLRVKVRPDWRDKNHFLNEYGY